MSFSSARAQTEPLAALVAVFAVGIGLSLYVGALDGTLDAVDDDREMASTATDAFLVEATDFGVVDPPLSSAATATEPTGYRLNATARTDEGRWQAGPEPPASASCEHRTVSIRVAPGQVHPGRLEVCTWPAR